MNAPFALDAIEQFRAAMLAEGIDVRDQILADGSLHRYHVEGDRKGSRNAWATLHVDEHPAGQFGCKKRHGDLKFSWSMKGVKPMSSAERQALHEKMRQQREAKAAEEAARKAKAAETAQTIWDAAEPAEEHPYLQRKGVKAHGLRVGRWKKTDLETGVVWLDCENALLVPMKDNAGNLHSLQAILPEKLLNRGTRDKDYLYGGEKRAVFHAVGKAPQQHDGRKVFILAEGYATGATIHEDTGHLVIVCFDTANLIHMARAIRKKQPNATILMAADNDLWTTEPMDNPGVHYARQAAEDIGGLVAIPPFTSEDQNDLDDKGRPKGPTDFNDLHQLRGPDAVAQAIADALDGKTFEPDSLLDAAEDELLKYRAEQDAIAEDWPGPEVERALPPGEEAVAASPDMTECDDEEDALQNNGHFQILGYDGPNYYVFSHETRQVMPITTRDLNETGLIKLAPINWWEISFPSKTGMEKKRAVDWFIRTAHGRGIYDPTKVRGRGMWRDKGRFVYHHGFHLTVDGEKTDITAIRSAYVYPMARQLPAPSDTPLTDEEGAHLSKVASMIRWSMDGSAALLAGWCFLSPICGALPWRPHIWLTGGAGSGKTEVANSYVYSMVRGMGIQVDGGTSTEAGVRQELQSDAIPVLIDEAESNNLRERLKMENILALIRQASSESGSRTLKGTVNGSGMHFHIRSMFCLSSINTNLGKKADADRLTKLTLRPPEEGRKGEEHWARLSDEFHKMVTDETLSARVLARALGMLPTIMETVAVFRRVAARKFGSQRYGDQFGILLAGAWCLQKSKPAEEGEVEAFINAFNWDEHVEDHDQDDASKALAAVMNAKIRMPGSIGDLTIYELVREAHTLHRKGDLVDQATADRTLGQNGMRVKEGEGVLLFGTGVPNLHTLVENTPYVTDIRGQMLRLPGASRYDGKGVKFNGHKSKCVSVPLSLLFDEDDEVAECVVADNDEF